MILKALRGKPFTHITELWSPQYELREWPRIMAGDFMLSYDKKYWFPLTMKPEVLSPGYRVAVRLTDVEMSYPLIFVWGRSQAQDWIDWDLLMVTRKEGTPDVSVIH